MTASSGFRLCACGSGLPFEACCGLIKAPGEDPFVRARQEAYSGKLGRRRRDFCQVYTDHKKSAITGLAEGLRKEARKLGAGISCVKGCSACCNVYVVATLQECEAIVYHLYHHDGALSHFLRSYEIWRGGIENIRDTFFEISRLQQKRMSHENMPPDDRAFDAGLVRYAEMGLPCPFLLDNACSIYEVRPYVCAGLVSVSPRDWCRPGHQQHSRLKLLKAEVSMDRDMPYFASQESKVALTNMPALVYEILRYGWEFLARVPGCVNIKQAKS